MVNSILISHAQAFSKLTRAHTRKFCELNERVETVSHGKKKIIVATKKHDDMSTVYQPVKGLYVARPQMNDTAEGKNM